MCVVEKSSPSDSPNSIIYALFSQEKNTGVGFPPTSKEVGFHPEYFREKIFSPLAAKRIERIYLSILEINPSFSMTASRAIRENGLPGPTACHSPALKVKTTWSFSSSESLSGWISWVVQLA